jgi:NADH-quinone oxidoreductase subunit F
VLEALERCRASGRLGRGALGRGADFDLAVAQGAGAFVCGEETAMIAALEGRRAMPRLRPPFPAQSGLRGAPTLVNNVETLASVPWIIRNGAAAYAAIGTERSRGTKVFALAGKIARAGLIEVPMGITIREIVEDIGGGVPDGRKLKAVQVGGPSGGCIPAALADTPVEYESLAAAGGMMGSGGLVVLDDSDCMVEMARYFLAFTQDQSCGKCTFCRIGTRRLLEIMNRLCEGRGEPDDLAELERLGALVQKGSLCGLGRTAPNPVLSTLRYFRDEYEAHLKKRCPAGKCRPLIRYRITERCVGCTICAQHCPADAIAMEPYKRHRIDAEKCTKCDLCRRVCPEQAVAVE